MTEEPSPAIDNRLAVPLTDSVEFLIERSTPVVSIWKRSAHSSVTPSNVMRPVILRSADVPD